MRIIRNLTRYSAVLVATSAFGFAACDDDPATNNTDTAQPDTNTGDSSDTSAEPDSQDDTAGPGDTSNPGDTTTNPCEPNPCTTAPAAKCSDDNMGVVTATAPGTCTATGSTFTCEYTETTTACGEAKVCAGGACVDAGDACEYTFDQRVSYVTEIKLGNQGTGTPPADDCCFDFTGDGKNDNKLGSILKAAAQLAQLDINGTIAEQIAGGSLTLLLETKGVEDVSNDSSVSLFGFYGDDADADTANNAGGTSHFTVDPASFQAGTDMPLIGFPNAKIEGGVFTAGPNLFQLSIPIVGANLELSISETQVEGEVAVGPNGQGLTMGGNDGMGAKLGGVIKRTDLFKAINTFMKTCTCVTLTDSNNSPTEDLISTDTNKCNKADTSACTDADGSACKQLPQFCGGLIALVQPDVDLDEDGTKDAISIGVWLKATSATVDGVQQCVEAQ